jgi:hypothetical protein
MTLICDAILKMMRKKERPEHLQAWVKACVAIVAASEGQGAASVFQRRVKAADVSLDAA